MPRTARQFHLDRTYHWRPLGSRAQVKMVDAREMEYKSKQYLCNLKGLNRRQTECYRACSNNRAIESKGQACLDSAESSRLKRILNCRVATEEGEANEEKTRSGLKIEITK